MKQMASIAPKSRWIILVFAVLVVQAFLQIWAHVHKGDVTIGMRNVEALSYVKGYWSAPIFGKKARECHFVGAGTLAFAMVDNRWQSVPFKFVEDTGPGYTRATGEQSFGVWAWEAPKEATKVYVRVQHLCEDSFLSWQNGSVFTKIGPFATSGPPKNN